MSSSGPESGTATYPEQKYQTESEQKSQPATAEEAVSEVRDTVAEQMAAARQEGSQMAERQKQRTADQMKVVGSAIHEAARKLGAEGQETIARYARSAADQMEKTADYLKQHDLRQLYDGACDWARRRPDVFLGGMFVAGIALSRFLKASTATSKRLEERSAEETAAGRPRSSAEAEIPSRDISAPTPVEPVDVPSSPITI